MAMPDHLHGGVEGQHDQALSRRRTARAARRRRAGSTVPHGCPLSRRELEVLRLMALEGLQTVAIGHRLNLNPSTVRQHCTNAYRKLDVTHAVQALVVCFNAGWIDPTVTEIQDPTRYADEKVSDAQRAYLEAFDRHLAAGDDEWQLRLAKRRTDVASLDLQKSPRSCPSRDWMDTLIGVMTRMA